MGIYNIYLVDLVPEQARRLARFGDAQKRAVATALARFFREVCDTTDFGPHVSFGPGTPHGNELAVYFLLDRSKSIIDREGGPSVSHSHSGRTAWLGAARGMVSEVYVTEAGPTTARIANTAFHELMHNKLDMAPSPAISDLHTQGGGGIAHGGVGDLEVLTNQNRDLMRQALSVQIKQYWNADLIYNPRHAWRGMSLLTP